MLSNKKVGVAFGGGAALGFAHIGVLKALNEAHVKIEYLTGTSAGSIIAVLYAFGLSVPEIEQIALKLSWLDITKIIPSKYGLVSNKKLKKVIEKAIGNRQLEDAKIPVGVVATDISSGEKVVLQSGSAAQAIMASTCIPGIFTPIEVNKRLLVDGAICENVPVPTLKTLGADYTIGVDLKPGFTNTKPKTIIDIVFNSFNFTINNNAQLLLNQADLVIQPDLSNFSLLNTKQVKDLIAVGYYHTQKILSKFNESPLNHKK